MSGGSSRHAQIAATTAEFVAAMLRNYLEQDDALRDGGSIIVQTPGDPLTILVFQKGGNHLMVQVNNAEVVVA